MPRKDYKGRYGTVYFNTEEEFSRWEKLAQSKGVTFSSLAREALNQIEEKKEARPDLLQKCSDLEDKIGQLQTELRLKTTLLDRMEKDVFKLQNSSFSDIDFRDGSRLYFLPLIKLLKDGRVHRAEDIFYALNIDVRDIEACRLIQNQIVALAKYGLVTEGPTGWRWSE